MSNFFMRKIEVLIGNRKFTYPELDITFDVKFDTDPIPDEAECSIFNLSEQSIANISKGTGIVINAGYGNDTGTILSGVIANAETNKIGINKETKIKALNITQQYLNKNIHLMYAAGTTSEYIIKDLLNIAGGITPSVLKLKRNLQYQRGFAANGRISDVLRRVVTDSQSKLIIRNSSIAIVENNGGIDTGFLLNKDTGLISVEKVDKTDSVATHKIVMLLNHAIAPYSLLKVESRLLNGVVLVIEGSHSSSSFNTEVEVRAL